MHHRLHPPARTAPTTPQEKVTAIHSPARDAEVAAAVTTDFQLTPRSSSSGPTVLTRESSAPGQRSI
ncbi:DUF6192 family protein [Streptomyces sp. B3I8]|uniref:DUF6192 family protein n=1 Tax=Streptomyces sp. B3I8 TaxID=3042303 RepID=UPI00358F513B